MEILRSSISHSFSMVCIKNGTISYLVKCIEYFFFFFCIQFRGSEIIELQDFKPASLDDIANVHAKAYVAGLEKVVLP